MSKVSAAEARSVAVEFSVSVLAGLLLALCVSAVVMKRIDEMLVTSMSIIVAAAIPGIALTAAAQRPVSGSPLDARRLGGGLLTQVRFWFSYLWVGGLSVMLIVVGRGLDWSLPAPTKPVWMPEWTPAGGYWIIALALAGVIFTAIRSLNIVRAVEALVQLGTDAQVAEAAEREAARAATVAAQLRGPADPGRGADLPPRPRH